MTPTDVTLLQASMCGKREKSGEKVRKSKKTKATNESMLSPHSHHGPKGTYRCDN